ncbi:hypothetical protein [Planktothrix agardhii]|uniref:hypothetical protein n=1 Tax=Planktothrix agardhii TaxID=1160 RepID=UPI001D09D4E5|nr:hypothetical protein [Planktothrix agardhii]MCB8764862.1 hypothetical protein [Planktothrix agardhii 1809]MCB8782919.1 hypothetical protein [Planktothrix agardhii 1808]MCF3566055.1 hypothetical protein [Planktothrix agardhii 1807]
MAPKIDHVYALNLYLFAFKLKSGLTADLQPVENPVTVVKEQYQPILDQFKPQFKDGDLNPQLRSEDALKSIPRDTLDLLETQHQDRNFYFKSGLEKNSNPQKPKSLYSLLLYPQKISDTYSLLLHIFRPQDPGYDQVKLDEIKQFHPKSLILNDPEKDFLGQTLLVTAFLPENTPTDDKNLRAIAEQLRYDLFGDYCNTFYQQGKLLGSYIVEYGNPSRNLNRILIVFYLTDATSEKIKPIYWNLPELFLYYHKIAYTFQFSRQAYQEADELIRNNIEVELRKIMKLDTGAETSNLDLDGLKKQLITLIKIAPKYTLKLRNLEHALNTVNINVGNYQRILKRLQQETEDDLEFFVRFLNRECQTFPTQIQADLNYLKPASNLLDQAISSIRGLVEIEQAKIDQEKADILRQSEEGEKDRDKSLERTISTFGVGLAAGGIASSITSAYIEKPLPLPYLEKSLSVPPFILAFLLSVGIAVIAGFITWKITKKMEKISLQEPPPTAECISEANATHEE